MKMREFFEGLLREPAVVPTTVWIPDQRAAAPAPPGALEAPTGYFTVRLSEMFLTDARYLFAELTPATFFMADFHYGGKEVSQPCFVGKELMKDKLEKIGGDKLRIRFKDTLVIGPTPYAGGDVGLFVGLFQAKIADHRAALFSVFETLFSSVGMDGVSAYIKVADKLSSIIFASLGAPDVKCLLAERRVIGLGKSPESGYLVYLHGGKGEVRGDSLVVQDGFLHRDQSGHLTPVTDLDFCVVRIERTVERNDYMSMAFHSPWKKAHEKMLDQKVQEAQALMLECAQQIVRSHDLSEDNKVSLIKYYQSKLIAARSLLLDLDRNPASPSRGGGVALLRQMQSSAKAAAGVFDNDMDAQFVEIARMADEFEGEPADLDDMRVNDQIMDFVRRPPPAGGASAAELVSALVKGAVSAPPSLPGS